MNATYRFSATWGKSLLARSMGLMWLIGLSAFVVYDTEDSATIGHTAYAPSNNRSETGITWDNRPALTSSAVDDRDTLMPMQNGAPVLAGAGDIASCSGAGDEATANLLDGIAGTVFTTGDNVYPDGTFIEFTNCYDPTWGRHKARTRPSAGNHDYHTSGAAGYYGYFGPAAGDPEKGYYSYDLGAWHIIVLNSEISVAADSPQVQWLRADLAAHPVACTAAYWHTPRFSSGTHHGSSTSMRPFWQALYDFGADVVLVGHEHNYERFASQDPNGVADPGRGIREFVVGTGGKSHYTIGTPIANSEVRNADTYGVLKLTLHPTSYDWEFIPEAGKTFTDSGAASCVLFGASMFPIYLPLIVRQP
jgi:hypothetical protein